ncbi:MAG: UbiA family prenyltransferase [Gammaproteobacteria bacterium]
MITEPSTATLANPGGRLLAATRPGFLIITFIACLIGLATAAADGVPTAPLPALATLALAVLAHAGGNVLNDYFDALNGSDAANLHRCYPYTGGSRLIQNGVISEKAMAQFGYTLLAIVVGAGLWLAHFAGSALYLIGAAGLALAWAYSAPPLALMSRGLGELTVAGVWLLVVVGADYVQRGALDALPLAAGAGFALHVAGILVMNQFPDLASDLATGKFNLVVRLGSDRARWVYPLLLAAAALVTVALVVTQALPPLVLLALGALLPGVPAARRLWRSAEHPGELEPAIRGAIAAAACHGLLTAAGLMLG